MDNLGILGLINKEKKDIEKIIISFIGKSRNIIKKCKDAKKKSYKYIIDLIRDTYIHNLFLKFCMMKIITNNDGDEFWFIQKDKLDDYITEIYNDKNFETSLIYMYRYFEKNKSKNKIYEDYLLFLNKLLVKNENENNDINYINFYDEIEMNILQSISNINSVNIKCKLFNKKKELSKFDDIVKHDNMYNIKLTDYNYNLLYNYIDDIKTLKNIEDSHHSKTDNTLKFLVNLVLLRNKQANDLKHQTYYSYINRGKNNNKDTIKTLVEKLDEKLKNNTIFELQNIAKIFNVNSISKIMIDKINNIHQDIHFKVSNIFPKIFNLLNEIFGIKINKIDDEKHNIFEMRLNDMIGKLYIEFIDDSKMKKNITLKLSDKMLINKNKVSIPEIVLVCNNVNELSYNEIINLFGDFGEITQNLFYKSNTGKINYDPEFNDLIPTIFKYIAKNEKVIKYFIEEHPQKSHDIIFEKIQTSINISKTINLKLDIINSKFEHLLHNSKPIINKIQNHNDKEYIIKETYNCIYKDTFYDNKLIEIPKYIDPNIISKLNSYEKCQYSIIMNDIFGYACYYHIFENKKAKDFIDIFFNACNNTYGKMIKSFIKDIDEDTLDLYLTNKFNIDDDNQSTYFAEQTEIDNIK